MTDDLIARLRSDSLEDCPTTEECADALEAKDRRIAGLEDIIKFAEGCVEQKNARIAELTAALKPFVWTDAAAFMYIDMPADYKAENCNLKVGDLRAARAAYLGEKK